MSMSTDELDNGDCDVCGGTGEITTLDRKTAACGDCVGRDLNPIIDSQQARIAELEGENEGLRDKALRFDLDQAGISRREAEATELVELRAELEAEREKVASLRNTLDFYAEVDHYRDEPHKMTVAHEDKGRRAREALAPKEPRP